MLAVCGGYQLLGRGYRGFHGEDMPGIGLLPLETVAGERRMIGDVLLECELEPGEGGRSPASRTTPAARASIRAPSRSAGSSPASATTARAATRAAAPGRVVGTYLHGPLLPRNPWLADWLLAQALAHRTGSDEPPRLEPLPDELEHRAHEVSAGRARARGGRF